MSIKLELTLIKSSEPTGNLCVLEAAGGNRKKRNDLMMACLIIKSLMEVKAQKLFLDFAENYSGQST